MHLTLLSSNIASVQLFGKSLHIIPSKNLPLLQQLSFVSTKLVSQVVHLTVLSSIVYSAQLSGTSIQLPLLNAKPS